MAKKLKVGILFGGRSGEHEISLLSATSILRSIDRKRYDVVPIGISKQGKWLLGEQGQALLEGKSGAAQLADGKKSAASKGKESALMAGAEVAQGAGPLSGGLDLVFPVLHGTFGEDGTIQGLLEMADVAYVGSGVLGSAAGMDKDVMKRLFDASKLPQTPFVSMTRAEWKADPKACRKKIEKELAYPIFVKPANLGSSVGISKVHDRSKLAAAMDLAAGYDRKLVIEQGVGGPGVKPRELEVAVLGNDNPEASVVGEIVPGAEFYDYDAKYFSNTSVPIIPAKLSKAEVKQIQKMAIEAFKACGCSGLARVDFLMEPKGKKRIYLNEINTMPGFTNISMYPKLWEASGLPYAKLIDKLIDLALERWKERQHTSFSK